MKAISVFLLLTIFFIISCHSYAQVTVGNSKQPVGGAILQLKENEGYTNSKKGLLLPRVNLITPDSLYPMFGVSSIGGNGQQIWSPSEKYNTTSKKAEMDANHIGLTVFNMTSGNTLCPGVYIWNGNNWKALNYTLRGGEGPDFVIDNEGNIYKTHQFGDQGIWMVENMRITSDCSTYTGTDFELGTRSNQNQDTENKKLFYAYPSEVPGATPTSGNGRDHTYYNKNEKMGVLYPYRTAVKQDPKAMVANYTDVIQGICPDGWHIPSLQEWNNLATYLKNNPTDYITAGIPLSLVAGSANPMLSPEKVPDYTVNLAAVIYNAYENPAYLGGKNWTQVALSKTDGTGFNVLLTGWLDNDTNQYYGLQAAFWAATWSGSHMSVPNPTTGIGNVQVMNPAYVQFTPASMNAASRYDNMRSSTEIEWASMSVRCKKN